MNPNTSADLLSLYAMAADLSAQILREARADDWEEVLRLGQRYIETMDRVKAFYPRPTLSDRERATKHALIVTILENDAATRDLAQPSLARLGKLISTMKRQEALMQAYNPAAVATP